MGKKKNKTTTPVEPRADRRHKIPKDYIEAVAENVHASNPSVEILENTFNGVYSVAYVRGYQRRIDDAKFFKEKREKRLKEEWDRVSTEISDEIYKNK